MTEDSPLLQKLIHLIYIYQNATTFFHKNVDYNYQNDFSSESANFKKATSLERQCIRKETLQKEDKKKYICHTTKCGGGG